MRTEFLFKSRRKPLVGEIVAQHEDAYDVRYVDRDGKFRCVRLQKADIREARPLLIDVPRD